VENFRSPNLHHCILLLWRYWNRGNSCWSMEVPSFNLYRNYLRDLCAHENTLPGSTPRNEETSPQLGQFLPTNAAGGRAQLMEYFTWLNVSIYSSTGKDIYRLNDWCDLAPQLAQGMHVPAATCEPPYVTLTIYFKLRYNYDFCYLSVARFLWY
jgi:hypothetical protein